MRFIFLFWLLPYCIYGQQVFDVTDPIYNLDYDQAQIAIRAAFEDAKAYAETHENVSTVLKIPSGTYYLKLANTTLIDLYQGPDNLTVTGDQMEDTILISDSFFGTFFTIRKTDHFTLKNITLIREGTPFFQGKVEHVENDGRHVFVRRSSGFMSPLILAEAASSQHTLWKFEGPLQAPKSHSDMRRRMVVDSIIAVEGDPDLFLFKGKSKWEGVFGNEDRVIMKAKYGDSAIKTSRADHIVLENLVIKNTGSSALRVTSGEKNFIIKNVHVKRSDAVNASGEVPFYACGGGGFSLTHGDGVSLLQDCTVEGSADDPLSIHTYDSGDLNNPPTLTVNNNTFKDVHGDIYLAELHNVEFYNNTFIRTNLQFTNRSGEPCYNILFRDNTFIENVREGTIRVGGINVYREDTSQWHHDIEFYNNRFIGTGKATSILKLKMAKNIIFSDNLIDGFLDVNINTNEFTPDPGLIHFDNLEVYNLNPELFESLTGNNNCVTGTNPVEFQSQFTNHLIAQTPYDQEMTYQLMVPNICLGFCGQVDAGEDQNICFGDEVTLSAFSEYGLVFWDQDIENGLAFTPNETATYTVNVIDDEGCVIAQDQVVVTVQPIDPPSISFNEGVLSTNREADYYQWINCETNTVVFEGVGKQVFIPVQEGDYALLLDNCSGPSNCITVSSEVLLNIDPEQIKIKIHPNPVTNDLIKVRLKNYFLQELRLDLYTISGVQMYSETKQSNTNKYNFSGLGLTSGSYMYHLYSSELNTIIKSGVILIE